MHPAQWIIILSFFNQGLFAVLRELWFIDFHLYITCRRLSVMVDDHTSQEVARKAIVMNV